MLETTDRICFLDGAAGTMLQMRGLLGAKVPESVNLTHPEVVQEIHRDYIRAGSDLIYAMTFSVNRYKLGDSGYTVDGLVSAAVANAKAARAAENADVKIGLDCGPIGKMLEPNGDLKIEDAYEMFREVVAAGERAGVDFIIFETMTDLLELKTAILAAKENSSLPVFATMSFEANGRTFAGVPVAAAALTLDALGVAALGINCSLGPDQIYPLMEEMSRWTEKPLIVKSNAGLPNLITNEYDLGAEDFARQSARFADLGVRYIGGCCGTTPDYIRALAAELKDRRVTPRKVDVPAAICSGERVVALDRVRVVGERVNPTGKKRFKEALFNNDMSYILSQALEQTGAGADILDVNVGVPGIDEPKVLVNVVREIQSVSDVPLQIDSSDPKALEAALRVYNGKPLINSVNGEEVNLTAILPLVRKYGAAVIGLTLDEAGLPKSAEERVAVARKIIGRAEAIGIRRRDIVIDCLTLTVSAQQDQALETLEAVRRVKAEFGVKTLLGVSNISFGLPDREKINVSFLTMAMYAGLDLPIINPNNPAMMGAVRAFNVLSGKDEHSAEYIAHHGGAEAAPKPVPAVGTAMTLEEAIEAGLRAAAESATEIALKEKTPDEIINGILIPTLDKVGLRFEKNEIFLPQLIQSAGAAQMSFEVLKRRLTKENDGGAPLSRGKVILATVKGDIHDIGKNIVKVLLENSGYQVLDLGKDVEPNLIVETIRKESVPLVGLSALMTTTVKNMAETIDVIRARSDCKIMVGGAVLTEDYAKRIGADFYGKDAKAAMDIAKEVIG